MFAKDWPVEAILKLKKSYNSFYLCLPSANKYLSHDSINEQISIMGQSILCSQIKRICSYSSTRYSLRGDEATDVSFK